MASLAILSVDFHRGRQCLQFYEFYYTSVSAHQLGFSQIPIKLFFADKIMAREFVGIELKFNRIHALESTYPPFTLDTFVIGAFCSKLYIQWWSAWKKHPLGWSANHYCHLLDANFSDSITEVIMINFNSFFSWLCINDLSSQHFQCRTPTKILLWLTDRDQPIEYDSYSPFPIIGVTAPMVANIMQGKISKKRKKAQKKTLKKRIVKRSTSATPGSSLDVSPSSASGPQSAIPTQVIYTALVNSRHICNLNAFLPSAVIFFV